VQNRAMRAKRHDPERFMLNIFLNFRRSVAAAELIGHFRQLVIRTFRCTLLMPPKAELSKLKTLNDALGKPFLDLFCSLNSLGCFLQA